MGASPTFMSKKVARRPADGTARGKAATGTSSNRHSSRLQARLLMSKSKVREALDTSVMCCLPPDSRHTK